MLPSVLWHCWLGIRKEHLWLSLERGADCLHMVQLMQLHHKTTRSLASFKSRLVLPFWYWLTQIALEKRPLNGCSSSSSSIGQMLCCHAAAGSAAYEYQRTSAIKYLGSDPSASVMMGLTQDTVQNSASSQAASWPQQRTSFNCPQVLVYVRLDRKCIQTW